MATVTIRAAGPRDAQAVAEIRAQTWRAAYAGVIPADVLARATGPDSVAATAENIRQGRWTGMIVAEVEPEPVGQPPGAAAAGPTIVGFASFGPERDADGQPGAAARPAHSQAPAELYAIYVAPAHWSTGAGRALMQAVLDRAAAAEYARISLWVLEDNPRAHRFYARAGFRPTGDSQVLPRLGGVTEVRYERSLR